MRLNIRIQYRHSHWPAARRKPADPGAAAERDMLASGRPLSAIIHKAGYHGVKSSNSTSIVEAVKPQYLIVSAGEGNNYGHPHEELLDRTTDAGATVLRADELSVVEVITSGKQVCWQSHQ